MQLILAEAPKKWWEHCSIELMTPIKVKIKTPGFDTAWMPKSWHGCPVEIIQPKP
ncbi:MAG: hypothetical protein HY053_09825 [Proteobacteria bacterium]|nr:hypothetical protein [Pseudomonadota bacterium]